MLVSQMNKIDLPAAVGIRRHHTITMTATSSVTVGWRSAKLCDAQGLSIG
jgi:hypothetical protein